MTTVRGQAVRFKIYPQDHGPRHAHGIIGDGAVIIVLREDGEVALADRPDCVRNANRREIRRVLDEARGLFNELVEAWEAMHR